MRSGCRPPPRGGEAHYPSAGSGLAGDPKRLWERVMCLGLSDAKPPKHVKPGEKPSDVERT